MRVYPSKRNSLFFIVTSALHQFEDTMEVCPLNNFQPSIRLIKIPVSINWCVEVCPEVSITIERNLPVYVTSCLLKGITVNVSNELSIDLNCGAFWIRMALTESYEIDSVYPGGTQKNSDELSRYLNSAFKPSCRMSR